MTIEAILLLVLAAVVHSSWNFLAKKSIDKQSFLWLAMLSALVIFFPVFLFLYAPVAARGWVLIVVSGGLEAVYLLLLGNAYQSGDLSVVYPIARGSAPLFVTIIAAALLGERITPGGVAGILLVVAGLYTLHLKSLNRAGLLGPLMSLRERPSQIALVTGLTIASYSVVDKVGVSYANPLLYAYLIFAVAVAFLTPYVLTVRRPLVRREWQVNKASVLAVAVMTSVSYALVLAAVSTSKVSYVSSVREMSVVFAALLGTLVLREPFGRNKVAGSLLIFVGVVLIGVSR